MRMCGGRSGRFGGLCGALGLMLGRAWSLLNRENWEERVGQMGR